MASSTSEPRLQRLDLLGDALHLRLQVRRVLARAPAPRDLLAHDFLAVAELLDLLQERAALGVERPGIAPRKVESRASRREHLLDRRPILGDPSQIEHEQARLPLLSGLRASIA
jgi:hypothetical protein